MQNKPSEIQKIKLKELQLELPKTHIKICCPSCDTEAAAEDINIQDKIAKCRNCNAVYPFQEAIDQLTQETSSKLEVLRPEGIDVFRFKNNTEFTIQQPFTDYDILLWIIPMFALLPTMLCLFNFNLFIIPALLMWIWSIHPFYNTFTRSKHKIYLNIDNKTLSLHWKPKKQKKEQQYAIQEIEQVYIKPIGSTLCSVKMIINGIEGQKHITLIPRLRSQSQAKYLEQEIEKQLGIIDYPVQETS